MIFPSCTLANDTAAIMVIVDQEATAAAIEEEVVAVFLLAGDANNKKGQRVPVSNRVRQATGSGKQQGLEATTGGWLQPSPSVARWGRRMGDSDAVEGWKAAAAREEKEAVGVRRGLRQQGPARKRGRKVRRARLEKRSRRGMADG
ncbi:hypothetical protein BHM03_00028679 [Ensete ventricosum]|nr:hypothetical protein BHM03_00028679 [Ensete ventricosum]